MDSEQPPIYSATFTTTGLTAGQEIWYSTSANTSSVSYTQYPSPTERDMVTRKKKIATTDSQSVALSGDASTYSNGEAIEKAIASLENYANIEIEDANFTEEEARSLIVAMKSLVKGYKGLKSVAALKSVSNKRIDGISNLTTSALMEILGALEEFGCEITDEDREPIGFDRTAEIISKKRYAQRKAPSITWDTSTKRIVSRDPAQIDLADVVMSHIDTPAPTPPPLQTYYTASDENSATTNPF